MHLCACKAAGEWEDDDQDLVLALGREFSQDAPLVELLLGRMEVGKSTDTGKNEDEEGNQNGHDNNEQNVVLYALGQGGRPCDGGAVERRGHVLTGVSGLESDPRFDRSDWDLPGASGKPLADGALKLAGCAERPDSVSGYSHATGGFGCV